jgi:hypothetical protein
MHSRVSSWATWYNMREYNRNLVISTGIFFSVDSYYVLYKLYTYNNPSLKTGRLGCVVVSVLATGPRGRGFKPGRGDGFLRVIKIHSTPSFG